MNFEDEPYVRLYTRDTVSWKRLGWEGQAVFCLLLRKLDRAGILEGTGNPVEDVALFIEMPTDIIRVGLERLIKQGIVEVAGDSLVLPKFIEAQAVVRGPKERQRECRERKRDMARLGLDPQQRGAVIYFLQSELGGAIKIGRATDLAKRLVGLATGRPDSLNVLASFAGTVADERTLHARLAAYRAKGEWFQDCPEVLEVVAYAAEHGAAVMGWLQSRDLSQPVTAEVTDNKDVTISDPVLALPSKAGGVPRPHVATSEPELEPDTPEPPALVDRALPAVPGLELVAPVGRRTLFVPDEWQPHERHRMRCAELRFDLADLVSRFRKTEFNRAYSDWDRRFDLWIEDERLKRETASGKGSARSSGIRSLLPVNDLDTTGAATAFRPTSDHERFCSEKSLDLAYAVSLVRQGSRFASLGTPNQNAEFMARLRCWSATGKFIPDGPLPNPRKTAADKPANAAGRQP